MEHKVHNSKFEALMTSPLDDVIKLAKNDKNSQYSSSLQRLNTLNPIPN